MSSTPDAMEAVSQRLDIFFQDQRRTTSSWGDEASRFVDAAQSTIDGGKRLRARFCLAGWDAVSETRGSSAAPPEATIAAAAALEIFHAAALVHDDIIDNSDTRRGRPASHRRLEQLHAGSDWHGDAGAFGRSAGILLGDLLVAWSDDLLEEGLRTAPKVAPGVRAQYARMRRDVTIGQYLDIAEESAFTVAPDTEHADRALRVASLKSARYSVEQPLLIGAALAGADRPQLEALSAFGHPIGMAFQLRDDVLGVFGDERVTGKPSGDDLREGKRTVLVAYTREAVTVSERRTVDRLIGDPALDATQIRSLQETIVASGALARIEELIERYAEEADRALSDAPLGSHAVGRLRDLAQAAVVRRA